MHTPGASSACTGTRRMAVALCHGPCRDRANSALFFRNHELLGRMRFREASYLGVGESEAPGLRKDFCIAQPVGALGMHDPDRTIARPSAGSLREARKRGDVLRAKKADMGMGGDAPLAHG